MDVKIRNTDGEAMRHFAFQVRLACSTRGVLKSEENDEISLCTWLRISDGAMHDEAVMAQLTSGFGILGEYLPVSEFGVVQENVRA